MKIKLLTYLTALLLTGAIAQGAHHANAESKGNCADGLIGYYFSTQEALAADNLDTAQGSAKLLLAAHRDNPCAQGVGAAAQAILKAPSIKEARVAFKTLSDSMIPLVEQQGVSSGEAHVVHCPMAFEFTGGSWLQKDKSVSNPYFGSEMFSCGAVEKSFGQVQAGEKVNVRQDFGPVQQTRDK